MEVLIDSILTHSVPFQIKRTYFRLFFNGFIQVIGNMESMHFSHVRFLDVLRYVCLWDIEHYFEYIEGLMIKFPIGGDEEAAKDLDFKRL